MDLKIVVLGSGATYPTKLRNTTCLFFKSQQTNFILDAGQGFQKRLLEYDLPFFMDFIVISHYHLDHFSGLCTYLQTLNAMDRKTELRIYVPNSKYLTDLFESIKKGFLTQLSYPVTLITITPDIEYIESDVVMQFIKVPHSVLTYAVHLESLNNVSYNKDKLLSWGTQKEIKQLIQSGFYEKDRTYHASEFIESTVPYFKVIYSADTLSNSLLWDYVDEKTLVLHECTHYYKNDIKVSIDKLHTHYDQIITKTGLAFKIVLIHLGAKITPQIIKKQNTPEDFLFSYDGMVIDFNSKKKTFRVS